MADKLPLPKKLPKWAYAIPLVILLAAIGSLATRLNVVANWPKVEGVVVEIHKRPGAKSDSGRMVLHDYPVYRYTNPGEEGFQFTANSIEGIEGLAIGDKLMIRINPNDKSRCYEVGWWSTFGTPVVIFAFSPLLLGLVIGAKFGLPKLHEYYENGIVLQGEKGSGESG